MRTGLYILPLRAHRNYILHFHPNSSWIGKTEFSLAPVDIQWGLFWVSPIFYSRGMDIAIPGIHRLIFKEGVHNRPEFLSMQELDIFLLLELGTKSTFCSGSRIRNSSFGVTGHVEMIIVVYRVRKLLSIRQTNSCIYVSTVHPPRSPHFHPSNNPLGCLFW